MAVKYHIITLFAAVVLLRAGAIPVEGAATLEEGWKVYDAGDYNHAYEIFSELIRENPENEKVNFAFGMAALSRGKLSHALFAFERVLMSNPGNQRARLELAWTYMAMEQYELARREFQQVRDSSPPEQVLRNIDRYMAHIDKVTSPWSFVGQVNAGAFHDDNANFGPASRNVETLIGDLEVSSNSRPQSTWGFSLSAAGQAYYELGEKRYWQLEGGLIAYQSWMDEASELEIGFYRGYLGLRRMGKTTLLDIPLKMDHLQYGHSSLINVAGMEPSLLFAPSLDWNHVTRVFLEYRDYYHETTRDGSYARINQAVKRSFGLSRHSVSLSLGAFREKANNESFANQGLEAGFSGELKLCAKNTLYASADVRTIDYDEVLLSDLQDEARSDEQWQFQAGARRAFGQKWAVDLNYRHINNDSNFGLYNYERNIIAVSSILAF